MTRINSAIDPYHLTDEHLLAEHREIKRMPSVYYKRWLEDNWEGIPSTFFLDNGHVIFFINKAQFTLRRYQAIYRECLRRGFNVTDYTNLWDVYKLEHLKDYTPTLQEQQLLINMITERISKSTKTSFHHYSIVITKEDAITLLNESKVYTTNYPYSPY